MDKGKAPQHSPEEFACPAKGDHCETCLEIARKAMKDGLVGSGLCSTFSAGIIAENHPLRALVEEAGGVTALTCSQRRDRAAKIGENAAEKWAR